MLFNRVSKLRSKVELFYDERYLSSITFVEDNIDTWNLPMNENRFKIFKNSTSVVQFIVRNNDRKPINLVGKALFITINDEFNTKTLLHKGLQIVDAKQGQVKLETSPEDVKCFPLGDLTFNVSIKENGYERLVHLDQMETARGFLQVEEGPWVGPRPEQTCDEFTANLVATVPSTYRFYSTPFSGPAQFSNVEGIQSLSIQCNNYSGKISVYGSLDAVTPTNLSDDWFIISINDTSIFDTKSQYTGNAYYSFRCMAMWIQVVFDPDVPYNTANVLSNTIGLVSYKN